MLLHVVVELFLVDGGPPHLGHNLLSLHILGLSTVAGFLLFGGVDIGPGLVDSPYVDVLGTGARVQKLGLTWVAAWVSAWVLVVSRNVFVLISVVF